LDRQSAVSGSSTGAGTVEGSAPSVEDFIELFFSNSDPQFTQMTEATIGDTVRVVLRMTTNGTSSLVATPLKVVANKPKKKKTRNTYPVEKSPFPLALFRNGTTEPSNSKEPGLILLLLLLLLLHPLHFC
jgi:hypothetical protein